MEQEILIRPDLVCISCHERRERILKEGEYSVHPSWGPPASLCYDCGQVEVCPHYALMTEAPHMSVCNACHYRRYGKAFHGGQFIRPLPELREVFGGIYVGGVAANDPHAAFLYVRKEDAIRDSEIKSKQYRDRYYVVDLGIGYICVQKWRWTGLFPHVSNDCLIHVAPAFPSHNVYVGGVRC